MDFVKLLHRGTKFAARDKGLFVKDVMHDGTWVHPVTGKTIVVTPEIRLSVQDNMKKFLAAGNKVPMPDGHVYDAAANRGFWPGPFVSMDKDVLGIAQPTDENTIKGMLDGSIDAVSVGWYSKYVDSNGAPYENVFEHVCLTNYPVITKQRNFVQLSGKQADDNSPLFDKTLLDAVVVHEDDPKLIAGLESVYKALAREEDMETVDLRDLRKEEIIAMELAFLSLQLGGHINKDGTFKGGFKGCVASGKSRALCAYIGRRAGKIK